MKKKVISLILGLSLGLNMCSGALAADHWSESEIELDSAQIKQLAVQTAYDVASEGIVLLRNEDSVLPLKADEDGKIKVNVFGAASLDPEFAGGGGADITIPCTGFYDALTSAGIEYNKELYDAYSSWYDQYKDETPYAGGVVGDSGSSIWDLSDAGSMRAEWNITTDMYNVDGSIRIARMDEQILADAEAYSDTAIVFLNRGGSEGNDLSIAELNLVEAEAAVLEYATHNYEHVIVIANTCNPMDLSFLDGEGDDQKYSYGSYSYGVITGSHEGFPFGGTEYDYTQVTVEYEEPHTYEIGACDGALISWALGSEGMNALGDVLTGKVNPSGRLTDTYAYDLNTNPAYKNFGTNTYSDNEDAYYLVYEEGIYVGYQYYETFAPEEVMYPFGYGLSYTTFDWEITDSERGQNEYGEDTLDVHVNVTNVGDRAGKDVVELYYTQPFYNDSQYGIEKSLVNLGDYAKTDILEPGESQTVTLTLNIRDMASWSDTAQCYVLENGLYQVEIASDAAQARADYYDDQSALKCTVGILTDEAADLSLGTDDLSQPTADDDSIKYADDAVLYTSDEATGTLYKRLFEDVAGYEEVGAVYMQREDKDGVPAVKEGTYPQSPEESGYPSSVLNNPEYDSYDGTSYWSDTLASIKEVVGTEDYEKLIQMPNEGVVYYDENGNVDNYTIQEMYADIEAGVLSEDDAWSKFLDQLSVYEMIHVGIGCEFQFPALEQYGVFWSWGNDGAAQVGMGPVEFGKEKNPKRDENYEVTGFPAGSCLAATWNKDLAHQMGVAQGYEAYLLGHSALYAPGLNLHRTPSGGRNFEYMSEDTFLGGTTIANLTTGMQEPGGLCAGVKHFMLNNQETHRSTVNTYLNEQTLRETYAESWEIAFKGGAMGIMGAYNNLGPSWVGTNYALNTSLLRDEWGFTGYIVSDYFAIDNSDSSWVSTVIAGHDSLEDKVDWTSRYTDEAIAFYNKGDLNKAILLNCLRRNTRHVFTGWSVSNGYIEDVDAAIAEYEAGGYNFDPVTPEEHDYTDVGWYGTIGVAKAEGRTVPVTITGNQGISSMTIQVVSPSSAQIVPGDYITDVTEEQTDDGYVYTLQYEKDSDFLQDGILFSMVFDNPIDEQELSISADNIYDRIGHTTTLYVADEAESEEAVEETTESVEADS